METLVKQTFLLWLPVKILGRIVSYLDLEDIKNLSLTCRLLSRICWTHLSKTTKITIVRPLNNFEVRLFGKSKRSYENISFGTGTRDLKFSINQIQLIPSIKPKTILLYMADLDFVETTIETLTKLDVKFKNVWVELQVHQHKYEDIEKFRSSFPNIKFTFQIRLHSPKSEKLLFDEKSTTYEYSEIFFDEKIKENIFQNKMINVKKLRFDIEPKIELSNFKNVEEIKVFGQRDVSFLQKLIENNSNTLTVLELWYCSAGLFKIPGNCQLKKFVCERLGRDDAVPESSLLKNQKHLRYVCLYDINNELLDILANNKWLSTAMLEYSGCIPLDTKKFSFLGNVLKIRYVSKDFSCSILKAILQEASNVRFLEIIMYTNDYGGTVPKESKRRILPNLKHLEVHGTKNCQYFLINVGLPNLEHCATDRLAKFLYGCPKLKSVKIEFINLNYDQIKDMLENLPTLEVFEVLLEWKDFKKSLMYIVSNIKNVVHFELEIQKKSLDDDIDIEGGSCDDETMKDKEEFETVDDVVRDILSSAGIIIWSRCDNLYKTPKFSFRIIFESN